MSESKTKKAPGFDQLLKKLETTVEKLEDTNLPLEKALTLYDQGVGLVKNLQTRLSEVKEHLEIVARENHDEPTKPKSSTS